MRPQTFAVVSIVLSMLAGVAAASDAPAACDNGSTAGWFRLNTTYSDVGPEYCYIPLQQGLNIVSVRVDAVPFQKARFSVPDPPYGTVVGENWFFSHTGDRLSGMEFDLGDCSQAGTVALGEILVDVPDVITSCGAQWHVDEGCEIQSCDGRWLPAGPELHDVGGPDTWCCQCWQCCYPLPPHDLYPPDGATDVSLDVVLTWVATEGFDCFVYITTDAACDTYESYSVVCGSGQFTPDFLEPGTTYYWWPVWRTDACSNLPGGGWSAVHSFTTEIISPAQTSTWGNIKALYRD